MERPTEAQARAILKEEIGKFMSRIDFIFDTHEGPRAEASDVDWWRKGSTDTESSTTDRNVAYLRAYKRMAAGGRLWAVGIPLARRRAYMDRSVMRRLERDGYVQFVEAKSPYFDITEKGDELIQE